jgi:hypothetical protein
VGFLRRFLNRLRESDEDRLAEEVREWCETVPGTVRIAEAPNRKKVTLAGMVNRISLVPGEAGDTLEAVLTDGTGSITASWTGRRGIVGLTLGSRVVVTGVLSETTAGRRMVNPSFEFAPAPREV